MKADFYDSPQEIYLSDKLTNGISIAYSNIQGDSSAIVKEEDGIINWLEGNININPQFADTLSNSFHLLSNSNCIDKGISFFVWQNDTIFNFDKSEYLGFSPDIGAFEYDETSLITTISSAKKVYELFQNSGLKRQPLSFPIILLIY